MLKKIEKAVKSMIELWTDIGIWIWAVVVTLVYPLAYATSTVFDEIVKNRKRIINNMRLRAYQPHSPYINQAKYTHKQDNIMK